MSRFVHMFDVCRGLEDRCTAEALSDHVGNMGWTAFAIESTLRCMTVEVFIKMMRFFMVNLVNLTESSLLDVVVRCAPGIGRCWGA